MAYTIKGAPFRYKGAINVEHCKTSKEVIVEANLNWEVDKCEVYGKLDALNDDKSRNDGFLYGGDFFTPVDNAFGIYRTDTNQLLGLVKGRYTPVNNIEAFNFFDNAIGKNKAKWQTAGYFGKGERVFVSAKLPNTILINGKDPVDNYLVFVTSHDGSTGIKILLTPIRVVCENTLNAAIKNCTSQVSFRHTASVFDNLDVANEILGICDKRVVLLQELYNKLFKIKMGDDKAQEAIVRSVLTPSDYINMLTAKRTHKDLINRNYRAITDSKISMKKINTICSMNDYYFNGIGQREYVGTAWGVYNAITGYYSNVDNIEGTKRMDSILFGDKAKKIENTGNLLLSA